MNVYKPTNQFSFQMAVTIMKWNVVDTHIMGVGSAMAPRQEKVRTWAKT
jgi:hypothetical protein